MVSKFESYLRGDGRSKHTIHDYKQHINYFTKYIKDNFGFNGDYNTVTTEQVDKYKSYCTDVLNNAPATVAKKLSSVRSFFTWMYMKEKILDSNVFDAVANPKIPNTIPRYLTEADSEKLRLAVWTYDSYWTKEHHRLRDSAIIHMFLSLCLRSDELCNLNLNDIRLDDGILFVRNAKGGNPRILDMHDGVCESIQDYLRVRHIFNPKEEYKDILFISNKRTKYTGQGMWDLIRKYAYEADIEENVCTHMLRHTGATLIYKNNPDIKSLQKIMGHVYSSTTDIYTHINDKQKREALAANPHASVGNSKYRELAKKKK